MESTQRWSETAAIRDYLRILWQRKWIALIPILLVPLAALYFSFNQERLYEASADVTVKSQSQVISSVIAPPPFEDPDRFLATQMEQARTMRVANRAVDEGGGGMTAGELLGASSVSPSTDTDILTFTVTDEDPDVAARFATAYARAFTAVKHETDTEPFTRAIQETERQLQELGAARSGSSSYQRLLDRRQDLRLAAELQAANTRVVRIASGAAQVQPQPRRNTALGLGLGIFLGIGLAFLWHVLDTRVRSAEQISDALGLPLLGRLPRPPRRLRRSGQVSMLADPTSPQAEAFRALRTNVEFALLGTQGKSLMVTSSVEQEGKSTTAVNLALAFARAGKRVGLLDLDLRRPMIDQMLGLEDRPGITDVALGHATLEEAITSIALTGRRPARADDNGNEGELDGVLEVVTSGPIPPNPGEFIASVKLGHILDDLSGRYDLMIADTAPLLRVGDAMALSHKIEGLVLLTRLNVVRRGMLVEARRVLAGSPAHKLGFVLTGAEAEEGYEYRGYYRYRPRRRRPVRQRVRSTDPG